MLWLGRLGLAIVHPRWALSVAGDRRHPGRSGSDLLLVIVVLLFATQLRALVGAVWLGSAVDWALGGRAIVQVLTATLTVDLGVLVVGALALWLIGRGRRELGRAFDLVCVAALPLVFVDLAATAVVRGLDLALPVAAMWTLSAFAYAWTGMVFALAIPEARRTGAHGAEPPADTMHRARRAGWAVGAVGVIGVAVQIVSIARDVDSLRPMTAGEPAPAFALPSIGAHGQLGPRVALASSLGKITIVDFWASWCGPCLRAMPGLDALARHHPGDVVVIAILVQDDPALARQVFDEGQYAMTLVADDGPTMERYGVGPIPHTVVIDRQGVVRKVARGGGIDLEKEVERLLR